jgi:hypothetical protein
MSSEMIAHTHTHTQSDDNSFLGVFVMEILADLSFAWSVNNECGN